MLTVFYSCLSVCVPSVYVSFLVSVIYSKAKLASACGGIIYFLSYVPYMYVAIREEVAHDKITAFEKCIAVRLGLCSLVGSSLILYSFFVSQILCLCLSCVWTNSKRETALRAHG